MTITYSPNSTGPTTGADTAIGDGANDVFDLAPITLNSGDFLSGGGV